MISWVIMCTSPFSVMDRTAFGTSAAVIYYSVLHSSGWGDVRLLLHIVIQRELSNRIRILCSVLCRPDQNQEFRFPLIKSNLIFPPGMCHCTIQDTEEKANCFCFQKPGIVINLMEVIKIDPSLQSVWISPSKAVALEQYRSARHERSGCVCGGEVREKPLGDSRSSCFSPHFVMGQNKLQGHNHILGWVVWQVKHIPQASGVHAAEAEQSPCSALHKRGWLFWPLSFALG